MSIRARFILAFSVSLALMAGIISYIACARAEKEAEALFIRTAASQMDRVEDIIGTYFQTGKQAAAKLAALPEAGDAAASGDDGSTGAHAALLARLAAIRAAVPGVETAFCGYRDGTFFASPENAAPEEGDPRARSWYSDTAWGRDATSVTGVRLSKTSKSLVTTVAARISGNDAETLGVAGLDISLGPLADTLRDLRMGRTGYLVLFDADGRILLDPTAQENLTLTPEETGDAALPLLAALPSGMHSFGRGGMDMVAFSREFAFSRWKAALVMERSEQAQTGSAGPIMLACGALCLVLAAFGVVFAVFVTRPLHALIRQSAALADGNVDALAGIPGRGPDITQLHGNLGRLTGWVMLLLQAEKEKTEGMETLGRKLALLQTRTDKAEKSVRDIVPALRRKTVTAVAPLAAQIAGAAATLSERLAAAGNAARERLRMANESRGAAAAALDSGATRFRQAGEAEKNADAAALAARNSAALVHDLIRSLETAAEALTPLSGATDSLKSGLAGLSLTANDVRALAEQTNSLGLNIAIETAGLGEDGKKISRAAETVRAIAEQAMAAAGGLDNAIAALDHGQAAHALAAAKSAAAAKRAAAVAEKVKTALAGAAAATTTTAEQIRILATALEGAALQSQNAMKTADALLRLSRDAENALQELAGAAPELAALTTNLALAFREPEAP